MTTTIPTTVDAAQRPPTTDYDVLIVGAGISGIDAAYHLKTERPDTTFVVLEGRDSIGGTWSLFQYPGIRSDSDVPTFGYHFKPWTRETTISRGRYILEYLRQAVGENGLAEHIRFGYRVIDAAFSRLHQRWTVTAQHSGTGETTRFSARFLFLGCGYFDYDTPFTPEFPGAEDFGGPIIHPQHWPQDLDYTGKNVVVIGSGATAVTLIPAMADKTGHITMLQRSPSYLFTRPEIDGIGKALTRLLGRDRAYPIIRRKNIAFLKTTYALCQRFPKTMSRLLITLARRQLPKDFDVDTHFTPRYHAWEERLCLVPGGPGFKGGDFFKAISSGRASVVTDRIERFTKTGILLESGRELPADIIVTATGLNLSVLGKIALTVDGRPVDLPQTQVYKTTMLAEVPNLAFAFGYAQLSWTLRVDLICAHFTRLLDYMDTHRYGMVEPIFDGHPMERKWLIDLKSGYAARGMPKFPYGGTAVDGPWSVDPDYDQDAKRLTKDPVEDVALRFTAAKSAVVHAS
ncbi:MAG TPA: NAD(P)/FAD-dependent oxidoreductase [Mycobacterium sp.]|nr:NAD(P)/FAD-dependent oxidoreductase [Mycobacterium sp.]